MISSASDQGTSESLVVPDWAKNLTIADLNSLQTPYGRTYLGIAQSYGPTLGPELMAMLHLGVLDIPHVEPTSDKSKAKPTNETTGDLAEILEAKYHVMEIFFQLHGQEIADALASSAEGALESLLMGAPTEQFSLSSADISKSAMSLIEQKFKAFLSNKEMDQLGFPGVPTKAAIKGVSHRYKNKQRLAGRPSSSDTGQYQAAFKSWMDS